KVFEDNNEEEDIISVPEDNTENNINKNKMEEEENLIIERWVNLNVREFGSDFCEESSKGSIQELSENEKTEIQIIIKDKLAH
ncbi:10846_t:CDS:2, partial [Acaulospora morrowiae]